MGRAYSLNGYINAARQRTGRTLLVEGVTDKNAIHRIIIEKEDRANDNYSIDHASLIDDAALSGLGAKSKVLSIREKSLSLVTATPRIHNLQFLIDREWDNINIADEDPLKEWLPPHQEEALYVTYGHSIENYLFEPKQFSDYIKHMYAAHFTDAISSGVSTHFNKFIALAGAYSMTSKKRNVISRLTGAVCLDHISVENGDYLLSGTIEPTLAQRGCNDPLGFVNEVNNLVQSTWIACSANLNARWIIHGHLGLEVVWACIGRTVADYGFPHESARQLAHGHKDEKERFGFSWISRLCANSRPPTQDIADWLTSSSIRAGAEPVGA